MNDVQLLDWQIEALQCGEGIRKLAKLARTTHYLERCDEERRKQAIRREKEIDRIRLKWLKRTEPLRCKVRLDGTDFRGEAIPKDRGADDILIMWFAVSCPVVTYTKCEAVVGEKRYRGLVISVEQLIDNVAIVRVQCTGIEFLVGQ